MSEQKNMRLRQATGWLLTALLAVEGVLFFPNAIASINAISGKWGVQGQVRTVIVGLIMLALGVLIPVATYWYGYKQTGLRRSRYAIIAVGSLLFGMAVDTLLFMYAAPELYYTLIITFYRICFGG